MSEAEGLASPSRRARPHLLIGLVSRATRASRPATPRRLFTPFGGAHWPDLGDPSGPCARRRRRTALRPRGVRVKSTRPWCFPFQPAAGRFSGAAGPVLDTSPRADHLSAAERGGTAGRHSRTTARLSGAPPVGRSPYPLGRVERQPAKARSISGVGRLVRPGSVSPEHPSISLNSFTAALDGRPRACA